jgi:exosome complex component RRP45
MLNAFQLRSDTQCLLTCIKAWEISVNLHVIDYDGNILDCANLAALCALAHFR